MATETIVKIDKLKIPQVKPKSTKVRREKIKYFVRFYKNIVVPFGDFFGEVGEQFEEFKLPLSSKKTYSIIGQDIVDKNNKMLNYYIKAKKGEDPSTGLNYNHEIAQEFIYKFMCIKSTIDTGKYADLDYKIFINDIGNMFNDDLIDIIFHYVKKNYTGKNDEYIDQNNHKFRLSTTFFDRHYIQLCVIGYMMKLAIPMATHYIHKRQDVTAKVFFDDVMFEIFDIVKQKTSIDLYNKLHEFVSMMVKSSHRINPIFDKFKIINVSEQTLVEDILSKLSTTIMPKLDETGNLAGYIATVVRHSASLFAARKDHAYDYLHGFSDANKNGAMNDDDNIVTEAERYDSFIKRPNEFLRVVRKLSGGDTLEKLMIRNRITVSSLEYKMYHDNLKMHDFQKHVMFRMFSEYYGSYTNMYDINMHTYTMLVIIMEKILRREGLHLIADFVTAEHISFSHSRISRSVDKTLFEDPRYEKLKNGKYRFVQGLLERKNWIRGDVVTLFNNDFNYNSFDKTKFELRGIKIEYSEDAIINEVLEYYMNIIV